MQIMNDFNGNASSLFDELGRQAAQVSNTALGLPRRIEDTIDKLDRGDIRVRVRSVESERIFRRLGAIQLGTNYTLIMSALLICATLLFVNSYQILALVVLLITIIPGWALLRLMRKLDRYDRMF
jgi:hypothetical protein